MKKVRDLAREVVSEVKKWMLIVDLPLVMNKKKGQKKHAAI